MSLIGSEPSSAGRSQLAAGLEAQKAGDLDAAETIYRAALAREPDNADALHLLAIVAAQRGRVPDAIGLFRRAIALNDRAASFHGNLANALHRVGMTEAAIGEYRRAIELDPGYSAAYSNLGNALRALRRRDEAVASYRRGCELNPRSPEGWNNLGIGLMETGKIDEASACFKRALELRPRYREAYNNLGNAWHEAGDSEQAIECFHRALEITPDDPGAQNNLAVVLQGLGRMDEAIERYRRALASQSEYPEAHNNLGSAMFDLTRLDEAIACYRRALELRPDYPEAEANCSHALLMKGDLEGGWPLYERRWEGSKDARGARRQTTCPQWYGGPIEGKRILLHTEQGFGDALQFVRYVPLVAARGASVVLECPARMKRLFASVEGVRHLVARGEAVPAVDLHCPLLSLPLAFSTTLATIPARIPYLYPDAGLLREWSERFPRDGVLRVGLAWCGEPRNRNDYRRSLPLEALAPLAGIGNVRFYSLQVGTGQSEAAAPPAGMQLVDLTGGIADFADTAALVAQLDLVISVDTAVAHLAGAIGRPVWLLNRFESEWRWLLAREDSPWYPTLRIFRQPRARDWTSVVDRVAKELAQAAREGRVAGGIAAVPATTAAARAAPPATREAARPATPPATREALRRGISLQRAGNAAGAREIYEEVLAREPSCADALHLLAIVRVESGQTEEGIALFRQAIALDDRVAAYHGNLGDALARAGRTDEAIAECRRALEIDPGSGAAYSSLGNALREKGALRQAIASYRQACRLKPGSVEVWNNLGVALTGVGEFEEAVRCLKQSLELYPDGRDALHNLATAHQRAEAPAEAAQCYARLLELDPRDARAHDGMGLVLEDQGRIEEAMAQFNQALALKPDYADAHNHLGGAYAELTRVDEAIASYRRALELQPGNASAEWNCSLALLSRGEYAEGWRLYERRWDNVKGTPSARRPIARPQWEGEAIAGKTILLHAEQGLGDTLQFARYVPLVAARGARVLLECQPQLKRLLAGLAGVAELVGRGEPVPDCDVHSPLLSLPRIFGTDLSTIPADIPYLAADESRIERWQPRMPGDAGLRIGLAWRGEPKNPADRKRSVALAALAPLAQVRDAHFFSLQLGAGAQEAADPPPGLNLIDVTGEIGDFADTAALLAHLDLVISVDTAVVHLAGALGKPVWLLNRFESEWRWMLEREDSPWYPSLRIFRQPRAGDWAAVIERVAQLLAGIAQGRRPAVPAKWMLPARDAYVAGDFATAQSLLRELASRYPDAADAHTNLGSALSAAGKRQEAMHEYLRALALDPKAADALNNLGGTLRDLGRAEAAIRCYGRAASLKPDYRDAWNNLGLAQTAGGRPEAAIPCFERAAALDPTQAGALVNLGKALRDAGMGERAAACFRQVLVAAPEDAEAHNNLANVLQEQGAVDEALVLYRRALELRPDYPGARENCAYALLLSGNFAEGWEMYEWRADGARSGAGIKRFISLPQWDGGDPAGRRLLVTTEQGLGDEIMFASMLPELHAMGARVVVECTAMLGTLFARSFPWAQVLVAERTPAAWEKRLAQLAAAAAAADAQCALGSLARFLRAVPAGFPRHTGYLTADPRRVAHWRARLEALGSGLKVGLSWRGGPPGFAQRRRSIDLAQLEPLFQLPGVQLVSLQYTDCRQEIDTFSEGTGHVLSHWQDAIDDYDETAALVAALDVVVSVCTAVVHLAGALGKPVWVMVPAVPEWRYGSAGDSMAWYPSARLLRQRQPGAWTPVIEAVATRLREACAARAEPADGPGVAPPEPSVERVHAPERSQAALWRSCFPDTADLRVGLLGATGRDAEGDGPGDELHAAASKLAAIGGVRVYRLSGARDAQDPRITDLQDQVADSAVMAEAVAHLDLLVTTEPAAAQLAQQLGKPAWLLCTSQKQAGEGGSDSATRIFGRKKSERPAVLLRRVVAALQSAAADRGPAVPAAAMKSVQARFQAGALDEAGRALRKLVREHPEAADAHGNLAIVLQATGHGADARAGYLRALALNPRFADALSNLGTLLQETGDREAALRCYRRAVQLRPQHRDAWANLGLALSADGQTDAAIAAFERAVEIAPDSRAALSGLGKALRDAGQHERAAASLRRALALDPGNADTQNNLAAVLAEQGRFDEAIALYRRALAARPAYPEALKNLGSAFFELTRLDEAIDCYRQSLRLRPGYAEAQWDCSHALLMRGDWLEGWKLYESRWEAAEGLRGRKRRFDFPQWNAEAIAGRSILVYTEQGLGDAIQFVRYVPLLAARGASVVLECQAPLARLFAGVQGIARLVVRGDAIPACDFHSPLLSLPRAFATAAREVPARVPYLSVPPDAARDKAGLVVADGRLRVGLVWRGAALNPRDGTRSIALEALRSLGEVPGARFYGLQLGADVKAEIAAVPELSLVDLARAIADFADTAALVEQLDLVISVDTAVAHLAGALGKPVWLLNRFESEWRWMLQRADSPWYPSMRIFRQPARGDWADVIARVKSQLAEMVPGGGRGERAAQPAAALPAPAAASGFDPARPEAWNARGAALASAGDAAGAVTCFEQALALRPDYREALSNLGNALNRAGEVERAIECLERALALRPEEPGALNNLAIVLQGQGRAQEAIELYRRALAARPVFPEAMNNLASALLLEARPDEAIASLLKALELRPAYPDALNNLGSALFEQGNVDAAVARYRQALALRPDYPEALGNLGSALALKRDLPAAIECYRRALQLRPEYPEAEANFAYALLMHGDFTEGWARHERRWDAYPAVAKTKRHFGRPQWDGREVEGATILLYAEQGFGDTIQFARYATLVAARRMTVVIECQPPLARLLRAMPGVSRVVGQGDPLPEFDFACPLMSLPLAFGTTLATIPDHVPYLRTAPPLTGRWQERFDGSAALRVGLAWRGEPRNKNDRKRSLPLAALAPLRRVAGARFYSLQIGGAAESAAREAGLVELIDWTADIGDFADTAALISCLDLVIAVDTAVVHLAGALGKPVWMLCRFESEWRWLTGREDTPWYPSMRIFRQELEGDWSAPVERVAVEVAEVVAKKRPRVPGERMLPAQQHYTRGELAAAENALRGMVAEWPAAADAWSNLGCVLQGAGKRAEALRHYLRGLALNPVAADAHNNLGTALQESGDLDGAILRYRRATELLPAYAQAWNNLGLALGRAGNVAGARAAFTSAARTPAGRAEAHYNLGNLAREQANLVVAGDEFNRALAADPSHASAHWNHGLALLFQGRYREGWAEYEWRWRAPEFRHLRREFREPAWNGEDLAGRTILLWSEQGLGDALQFIRYCPLVAGRRARVVLETRPELKRLLAATPGAAAVLAQGEALPAFDLQLPLLSLPRVFGTELETIPADVPYVHAPHAEVGAWRDRMPHDGRLRVGIAWAGARRHPADSRRSIHPERLASLAAVEGVRWFSLQKEADGAAPALPPLPGLVDTHGKLGDMADTAALVEHLDLVIAVDSAVAHLAGAMGKPVWLMCRHESEWRWMLEREDSPWYPTMRIFRQETPDDWTGVVRRIAAELERVTSGADESRSDASAAARELFVANRLQEAERALRTAISRRPAVAGLLSDLSVIVGARGRHASALMLCERALAIDPTLAAAHYNRGNALRDLDRPAEAVPSYRRAIELRPDYFKAYNNLGLAYKDLDRLDQVEAQFDHALRLNPDFPDAHVNLGEVARLGARLEEAERLFRRALEMRPDFAEAHWNLGSLLLLRGDFERGWPDYEWRWRLPELAGLQRGIDIPRWDGSDLTGRTLLLTAEQGLGDEIMFSSIIPEVAQRARRCLVECSIKLAPLFARSFPGVTLLPVDRNRQGWEKELATRVASIAGIDVQFPLGSLPALFRRRLGDFPPHRGYLRADPDRVAAWRERLRALGPGPMLGLSWRGGTKNTGLTRRSLDLLRLAPLVAESGATFVSLQYTNCARELAEFHRRTGLTVHHWQAAIDDYDETAALVGALDGIVSVCTAIVHLGGSLGRPVWVMAPAVPEWRYGIAGEGMPWYPAVRVLRQRAEGDWDPVISEVLSRLAALRSSPR